MQSPELPLGPVTPSLTQPDPRPPATGAAEAARRTAALEGLNLMYAYYEADPV